MTSLFQMGHFINKSRRSRNQVKNLVLRALSVDVLLEVVFRFFCQIMSNRLNREVYGHNLSFFLHLYITGVLQEELVDNSGLKGLDFLLDIGQCNSQLVDKTEDIEALSHIGAKGILVKTFVNLLQCALFTQSKIFVGELLVYYFHTMDQDLEVVKRVSNLLVDFNVDGSFDDRQEEFDGAHFEHIMLFQLLGCGKALHF